MAEGPSTTVTLSNQFVVKCSGCGHHVYKHIWSPCIGEPFETLNFVRTTNTTSISHGCASEQLFNCSWTHPERNNMHLSLLIKNKGEITG